MQNHWRQQDEAAAQLNAFINTIREKLSVDSVFKIDDLGELRMDSRGSIKFLSLEKASKASVKAGEQKKQEEKQEVKDAPKPTQTTDKQETTARETTPEQPTTPKKDTDDAKPLKKEDPKAIDKPDTKQAKKETPPPAPEPTAKVSPTTSKPQSPKVSPQPPKATPAPAAKKQSSGVGKAILIGLGIGMLFILLAVAVLYYLHKEPVIPYDESFTLETPSEEKDEEITPTETKPREPKGRFDEEFDRLSKEIEGEKDKKVERRTPPPPPPVQPIEESESAIPIEMPPVSADGSFHIIVGSFRNPEYAEKFSNDMIRSGYSSSVIIQPSGMHAVTLGSYGTREDALKAMTLVKNQHPNVWLLSQ